MTSRRASYPIVQRTQRGGPVPHLNDAAFRSRIISIASGGLSRRGVAALCGVPHSTLLAWLERGRAHPNEEPWGSFAVDFERASRGLEGAAAGAVSLTVARLYQLARDGDWLALSEMGPQLRELLNVLAARYPEEWGTHAHRKPEAEPDPRAWLERNAIEQGQLEALFADPPEVVAAALAAAGYIRAREVTNVEGSSVGGGAERVREPDAGAGSGGAAGAGSP